MAWLAQEEALVSLTPKEPAFHPICPKSLTGTNPGLFSSPVSSSADLVFRTLRMEKAAKPVAC